MLLFFLFASRFNFPACLHLCTQSPRVAHTMHVTNGERAALPLSGLRCTAQEPAFMWLLGRWKS